MPVYTYLNKNTQERETLEMSISEMEKFEDENTHMERCYDSMNICDPAGLGIQKPPSDFSKYVLGKVKQTPGADTSKIEKRWSIPREW